MQLKGKDNYTVFILGAGATRGAVKHVVLNRKRLRPPLNGDFFRVAETFARASGSGSADMQRLRRLRKVFKDELPVKGLPSMEEAFSLLYVVKDFPAIYKVGQGRKPKPGERQEVEDFLTLAFRILTALDNEKPGLNGYDRLASKLGPKDTIITLNYDTLLDSALVRKGWNPKAGYYLGGGQRKVEWRPRNGETDPNLTSVRLLKLHGSLNWFVRGSFANLSAVFEKKPVRVSRPRRNEISGHVRQIVPPIYGKFFRHDHWRRLWDQAHRALRDANVLVVVGCSLVDTDFHLRALVSRVARYRKKVGTPFRQAFFVDHSLQVRRKWMKALKGAAKRVSSIKTFEKFLVEELGT